MSLRREKPGHSAAEDMRCSFCGAAWPWEGDCTRDEALHQEIVKRRNERENAASRFKRNVLERSWRRDASGRASLLAHGLPLEAVVRGGADHRTLPGAVGRDDERRRPYGLERTGPDGKGGSLGADRAASSVALLGEVEKVDVHLADSQRERRKDDPGEDFPSGRDGVVRAQDEAATAEEAKGEAGSNEAHGAPPFKVRR